MANYRFKEFRDAARLSQEELAADVDLSISQISRFESGDREPRVDELLKIASRLNVPWQEIVEEGASVWLSVPLISWVSAGAMADPRYVQALSEATTIPVADLGPGDWIALKVEGDSMDRISPPESVIIVNRRDKRLVPNACYVIATDDGEASYKRYRPDPMRFEPVSTNTTLETLFPDSEPTIIGRVRKSILSM